MEKKRTCVCLGTGAQEREVQNGQGNFIIVQKGDKKRVICRSASSIEACT